MNASQQQITMTPIPKLDGVTAGGARTTPAKRIPHVDEHECVGCNLCWLVCPVEDCITMERVDHSVAAESWEQRTGTKA
jgi:dihydropyrimidine dehydrogenase (NAD+) subunit PreA